MTNPDNVGGLPEPAAVVHNTDTPGHFAIITPAVGAGTTLYTADQMRAYGELCRAAPAGCDPSAHVMNLAYMKAGYNVDLPDRHAALDAAIASLSADSAPAGSGEVLSVYSLNRVIDRVEGEAQWNDWSQGRILTELRNYIRAQATVIPDPQSMGDDEVDNIESYATALERMSLCNSRTADGANLSQAARFIHEYAALLRKLQQGADGWRPIESAPKEDGLKILGASNAPWTQDYYPVLVYEGYRYGSNKQYFGWQAPFDHDDRAPDPTHWMPLPAPPASQGQEGGANG